VDDRPGCAVLAIVITLIAVTAAVVHLIFWAVRS
jgi:hypothetical protein